jgi:hypothetical protein
VQFVFVPGPPYTVLTQTSNTLRRMRTDVRPHASRRTVSRKRAISTDLAFVAPNDDAGVIAHTRVGARAGPIPSTGIAARASQPYTAGAHQSCATGPCDPSSCRSVTCSFVSDRLRDLRGYRGPGSHVRALGGDAVERQQLGPLRLCARMAAGGEANYLRRSQSGRLQHQLDG